ncbi:hypothetical protein DCC85_04630 [Paenibacillus sp. CAA11]|uniref:S-layer homology domain-containing protein n=1 Tax=Paenibacillus sp. CAA11 TaxID=1532905 RepID=UPI000D3A6CF3|nr:S-layer homology domain-containing protein [Paenibacillus sp. CAA11]AWB43579.1 hypothetical protein DCC85_04630 [Paenibacillus sp. CAA11]
MGRKWMSRRLAAKLSLGIGLSAAMILQVIPPAKAASYSDIAGSYAAREIAVVDDLNIMNGTAPGVFSPAKSMTRAEAMTAFLRLLRLQPVTGGVQTFWDVKRSAWYFGYVQAGVALGVAAGGSDGAYHPEQSMTRQEAAVWLVRFLKQSGVETGSLSVYSDAGSIADWARASVDTVTRLGLMKGSGNSFRPLASVTRAEMAVMLARIAEKPKWYSQVEAQIPSNIHLGWQYDQTMEEYKQTVLNSPINVLSPRWYFMNKNGGLEDHTESSLVTWAAGNGRKIWAMVGNQFDADATHLMLSDSAKNKQFAAALAGVVSKYKLNGLNLDFENMIPADKQGFTAFTKDLGARLKAAGAVLSITVSPDLGTDWTEAFDYSALASNADYLVLMAYDEHWGSDPIPGSVASLPWVNNGLTRLLKVTTPNKIILGTPLYTRDWQVTSANKTKSSEDLTLKEQMAVIARYGIKSTWNTALGQYTASYTVGGQQHRIWLEEGRSLALKYQLARRQGLAGMAYWAAGGESGDVWRSLGNEARFGSYSFR